MPVLVTCSEVNIRMVMFSSFVVQVKLLFGASGFIEGSINEIAIFLTVQRNGQETRRR